MPPAPMLTLDGVHTPFCDTAIDIEDERIATMGIDMEVCVREGVMDVAFHLL